MKRAYALFFVVSLVGLTLMNIPFVKCVPSITYGWPTITVSGFTVGSPCSFFDVWNASNFNGWGVAGIDTFGRYQFSFVVNIVINSGYFRDTNVNVFFNTTWANTNSRIIIQNGANLTLGTLVDNITKRTTDGVNIVAGASVNDFITVQSGGVLEVYGCHFTTLGVDTISVGANANATIYETTLTNMGLGLTSAGTHRVDTYRLIIEGGTYGVGNPATNDVYDDLLLHSFTNALQTAGSSVATFTNLVARNNTKTVFNAFYSGDLYLINPDVDTWSFTYIVSPNGEIHRQYTFNLLVTYPNGTAINGTLTGARVTVRHYGEGGGVDYNATLNEDGTINETALTMGIYKQSSGDTINSYNPFNLHIYNVTGYAEYNGNFTLTGVKNEVIVLHLPVGYAGFAFILLGLIIGLVIGALAGYGSKR